MDEELAAARCEAAAKFDRNTQKAPASFAVDAGAAAAAAAAPAPAAEVVNLLDSDDEAPASKRAKPTPPPPPAPAVSPPSPPLTASGVGFSLLRCRDLPSVHNAGCLGLTLQDLVEAPAATQWVMLANFECVVGGPQTHKNRARSFFCSLPFFPQQLGRAVAGVSMAGAAQDAPRVHVAWPEAVSTRRGTVRSSSPRLASVLSFPDRSVGVTPHEVGPRVLRNEAGSLCKIELFSLLTFFPAGGRHDGQLRRAGLGEHDASRVDAGAFD